MVLLDFMTLCRQGKATPNDVDDYIDAWHSGDGSRPLHEHLGMAWEDYAAFVQDPSSLWERIR